MSKGDLLIRFNCVVAEMWLFIGRISLVLGKGLTEISGKCGEKSRAAIEKAKQYLYA